MTATQSLFPLASPFQEGYLRVSPCHEIWYGQYGSPRGAPIVFLHGGPGAGCPPYATSFFDPQFYHIVLLDQRGSGRSRPLGEVQENTTPDLISDLEALRRHLQVEKWVVFGGSWGSTLAIAYGQAHPDHCCGFILRGIFLGRKSESQRLWYGAQDTFPQEWQALRDFLSGEEQGDLVSSYSRRILGNDPIVAQEAAQALTTYSAICSFLQITPEQYALYSTDERGNMALARLWVHYDCHGFFMKDNQLLNNIAKIRHLPALIVHGRYDTLCRAKVAYELHQAWPGSELTFVGDAGHAAIEPGIARALVNATEKMKHLLQ